MRDRTDEASLAFEQWAIVELMGHRMVGGLVTEEQRFGLTMLRVETPVAEADGRTITQYYSGAAIFGVTVTSEDAASNVAQENLQRLAEKFGRR